MGTFKQGMKLYNNLDIPFMRDEGDLMLASDITSPGFRIEVEGNPMLHRFSNLSRTFSASHDGYEDDTPMEARRRRRPKNPFKKIGSSMGKSLGRIGVSVLTGDVATVGTNELLRAVGSKERVPTNTELINRGLQAIGSKNRVPDNPLLTGVIDRGGIMPADDRAKTIF